MTDGWSLIEFFKLGGAFMWPLLAFSIATVALVSERVAYLLWHDLRIPDLRDEAGRLIRGGQVSEAEAFLEGQSRKKAAATVFLELVRNARRGERRMEKAAEAEAEERLRRLESGFTYLTAIASLAPLTGFLGTVSGMIAAFRSIASADDVSAQLVANGIYEALITTVYGLCIAIVALIGYNLLARRVDGFAADVTKAVSDLSAELMDAGAVPAEHRSE